MPSIFSKPVLLSDTCHELGHTWDPSCSLCALQLFLSAFYLGVSVYTPLYFVSGLLGKVKRKEFLTRVGRNILQSSMFLGSACGLVIAMFCLVRKILGSFAVATVGFVPGVLSSLCAILIERKSRRGPLAVYMASVALETVFNALKELHYVKPVPGGEVLLFSAATSVLACLHSIGGLEHGLLKTIMDYFLKEVSVSACPASPTSSLGIFDVAFLSESFRSSLKAFVTGYCVQLLPNMVFSLRKIVEQPKLLLQLLAKKSNWQMASFFGSLVGIYKVVFRMLNYFQRAKSSVNAAVAGGIAGLSMLFARSTYLSLYMLTKACETLYMFGIKQDVVPYIKHFDMMLYIISTASVFHVAMVQPHAVRPGYWKFLLKITGNRLPLFNYARMNAFGMESNKLFAKAASGV